MITIKAIRNDVDRPGPQQDVPGLLCMNKYGHLNMNLNKVLDNTIDTNSGIVTPNTQRICIASNNVPIMDIQKKIVDKRIGSTYRYKTCGGISSSIDDDEYCAVENTSVTIHYTLLTPPINQTYIASSNSLDSSSNNGCNSVYLKYIDSNGDVKEDTVDTNGNIPVSIGTNVREIIEFKCSTFGSLGYNVGDITLYDDDILHLSSYIYAQQRDSRLIGIEIPQNGYTLLKSITIASLEQTNTNVDIELKLLLVERHLSIPNYVYRTLLVRRCRYQKSITFDLTGFSPIYGSQSPNINFAIYPVLKAIVDTPSNTTAQVFLDAINVD